MSVLTVLEWWISTESVLTYVLLLMFVFGLIKKVLPR